MNRYEAIEQVAKRALAWANWWCSKKPDQNIDAPEMLDAIQKDLRKALAMPEDAERVALLERIDAHINTDYIPMQSVDDLLAAIRAYLQGGA